MYRIVSPVQPTSIQYLVESIRLRFQKKDIKNTLLYYNIFVIIITNHFACGASRNMPLVTIRSEVLKLRNVPLVPDPGLTRVVS